MIETIVQMTIERTRDLVLTSCLPQGGSHGFPWWMLPRRAGV
jgi:hypothetical protein